MFVLEMAWPWIVDVLLEGTSDVNVNATRVGIEFGEEGIESEGVWGSSGMVYEIEELLW